MGQVKKKGRDLKDAINRDKHQRLAMIISTVITQEIRKKLTYEYLGIFTGNLRNNSGTFIERKGNDVSVWVGTSMEYGVRYETGDWTGYKASKSYEEQYRLHRSSRKALPEWRGKKKRPFLRDTIESAVTQSRITAKLNGSVPL